jgi:hypothetical protein
MRTAVLVLVCLLLSQLPMATASASSRHVEMGGHLAAEIGWYGSTPRKGTRVSGVTSGSRARTAASRQPSERRSCSSGSRGMLGNAAAQDCVVGILAGRRAATSTEVGASPSPTIVPPSRIAVEDAVSKALPTPVLGIDPRAEGLTGLESRLWYRDDGRSPLEPVGGRRGLSVTATAGPHTITARAWIVEYRWDMGDGSRYVTRAPGSPSNPAARHVYERKGNYTITVETVWAGEYTWQLEGASGAGELGPVSRASTQSYGVVEVRSVLVG